MKLSPPQRKLLAFLNSSPEACIVDIGLHPFKHPQESGLSLRGSGGSVLRRPRCRRNTVNALEDAGLIVKDGSKGEYMGSGEYYITDAGRDALLGEEKVDG